MTPGDSSPSSAAQPSRVILAGFALCVALLFLIVNRPAYKAFFTDDDLDNMANARELTLGDVPRALIVPASTGEGNFRAAAYLYYYVMVRAAGLRYPPYVAGIHAIHLLNVLLIWLLARALGAELAGACAAALLYAFHAAAFDIYWKAMYVFDLLCATFTLAALLAYIRGRVLVSLVCFWLSLKSKEIAIFLPAVLLAYEFLIGERRWKRTLPFFAISAMVGALALFANTQRDNVYTFRFQFAALSQSARYYSGKLLLIPYGGFVVLALPLLARSRRVWFGVLVFLFLLVPMLFLPGRLFAAYLYVPLIGLSVALSTVTRPLWLAVFFLAWIPWNYRQFRIDRREALAVAEERRTWFQPVAGLVRAHPEIDTFVYDGAPDSMPHHAVWGAVRNLRPGLETRAVALRDAAEPLDAPHLALLVWDEPRRRLHAIPRVPDASYIRLNEEAPAWQLTSGWRGNEGHYRWIEPRATARLFLPAGAQVFEMVVNAYLAGLPERRVEVLLDGARLGTLVLRESKPTTFRLPLPPGPEGPAVIELRVDPPLKDPNGPGELGQPIAALGFPAP